MRNLLFISSILLILCQTIHAQLGPVILSPAQNGTVAPGDKVDIVYHYQNMGTGNYSIDIQLWQDAAVTIPVYDIVTDREIKAGNSSGVHLDFFLNDTYTWKVSHGLNETFWLTITENVQTKFYPNGLKLRSRPVMLHTSAANYISPNTIGYTLLLSLFVMILF